MCMHKTMYMCERMGGLAPSSLSDYSLSRNPPFTHTSPLESSWKKPLSSAECPQHTAWHSQSEHKHVRNALFWRRLMTVKLPHSPVIRACRGCFENSQLQYAMGRGEGAVHCLYTKCACIYSIRHTSMQIVLKLFSSLCYIFIYITASPSVGMRRYGGDEMRFSLTAWMNIYEKRGCACLSIPSPDLIRWF